ncbi:hypothetical protein GPJ56_000048 [Histomonas meleagridis]|uniref:uncharacterized protein n=1 Tax=Histomonas meleagridis TaxID=135588 RepID=UPI00355AAA3D|nr:hypothetical protein GPJ56_000048 [Histomonas meleagridis]KAH0805546.1 hypothetical protein GO595_001601 [Histomonas meleagridis]
MEPWERECIAHRSTSMRNQTPGPAYYNVKRKFKKQCPAIKIKGRHFEKQDVNKAPYYNIPSSFGKVAKIGMHTRTEIKPGFQPPGPSYIPPPFGSDARKISMTPTVTKKRYQIPRNSSMTKAEIAKIEAEESSRVPNGTPGPGPGAYSTRDHTFDANGKRGCSIIGHHDFNFDQTCSPGPGRYAPRYDAVLPQAPKVKFHNRPKEREKEPGVGYRNLGSTLSGPKFTMKARANDDIVIV